MSALNNGFIVNGRYHIDSVTGQNILGYTYLARDVNTNEVVFLKEFFPEGVSKRENDSSAALISDNKSALFTGGKSDFLNEARALSAVNNINIVNVKDVFECNNTAYYVTEYFEGISLKDYIINSGGKIAINQSRNIIYPLIDALGELHKNGIIHYNISPLNIYITNNGIVKLTDFSYSLINLASKERRLDSVISYGFSPKEMYSRNGQRGAFSDVYALAATLYSSVTGLMLPDAVDRFDGENISYPSDLGVEITPYEEAALKKALSINSPDRYPDMNSFKQELMNQNHIPSPKSYQPAPGKYSQPSPSMNTANNAYVNYTAPPSVQKKKGGFPKWIIPVVAVLVLAIAGGVIAGVIFLSPNPAKDFKYSINGTGVVIEKYIGNEDKAEIPSEIEGKPVEIIGANSFYGSPLKEIVLPNTIKTIEKGAFSRTIITSLNIPESVTEIKENSFRDSSLESIVIPGSIKIIPNNAFSNSEKLKSVKLLSGVTKIGEYVFSSCYKLDDISLPDTLDTIETGAFSGCKGLKKITVPNHVSSIKTSAFTGCTELTAFEASGTSTSNSKGAFASYVFSSCNKLKIITIPKSIKTLSKYFISGNKVIETVKMQEGLKTIGNSAFSYCDKLKKADIPYSVSSIGSSAFWGCKKLKSVSIHSNIKVIKRFTFDGCKSLKSIYIPSTVKKVETLAFADCTSVKKILIGYKVKNIGKYAFSGCNKIKSLVVPSKMKTIGKAAFFGMKGLKSVVIPKSVKKIKSSAFLSSKKLKRVLVAKKCKVDKYAFPYRTKVRKIK